MEFLQEVETWITVAFLALIGIFIYLKLPQKAAAALDERAAKIGKELDEAKKLREEAQALLSEYASKRQENEREARAIVEQAQKDADTFAAEMKRKLQETLERRLASAQQKIAQAEAQAVKDLRAAATDLAMTAAQRILREEVKGGKGSALIDQSIAELKEKLN